MRLVVGVGGPRWCREKMKRRMEQQNLANKEAAWARGVRGAFVGGGPARSPHFCRSKQRGPYIELVSENLLTLLSVLT